MTDDPIVTSLKLSFALTEIATWWGKEVKDYKALDFPAAALIHATEASVSFIAIMQELSAPSSP